MKTLFRNFVILMIYPFAWVMVATKSEIMRFRSLGKSPKVHFQSDYKDQKILLIALYQKGKVRPDCRRLLRAAKDQGFYVLAVNTLRLDDPAQMDALADCYIEKFNFGRDFGSYKTGFFHIYKNHWSETCPRLLMLNDSIFYARDRVETFLDDMMSSDIEALGSTENHEIEQHLGSFCIALCGTVLRKKKFRTYWSKYRLSDIRPVVIRRGEMGLSKTLKKCVSASSHFQALYDTDRFMRSISTDHALLEHSVISGRSSTLTAWKSVSTMDIIESVADEYIQDKYSVQSGSLLRSDVGVMNEQVFVRTYNDVAKYLERHFSDGTGVPTEILDRAIIAMQTEVFMSGSQLHQNAAILLKMGLPLIKLDGVYRGMFNFHDIETIKLELTKEDAAEFQTLILERPFGGDIHRQVGWKLAAFMRGLI